MRAALLLALLVLAALPVAPADAPALVTREAHPVVLTGAQLPALSVVPHYVERPPLPFQEEEMDGVWLPLGVAPGQAAGAPVERLFAARWDAGALVEIPFQVDERFVRYLTNYASGFGAYSQSDHHLSYAFDVEGKKKEGEVGGQPWLADFTVAGDVTTADPVAGLDHDDELVFLYRDAGARASHTPAGLVEVAAFDPLTRETRYAYIGLRATAGTPPSAGVTYARDADADHYVLSNHGSYGGAPGGWCHDGDGVDAPWGEPRDDCPHRRPKDSATVTAPGYRFHYSGRWKLDGLDVRQADGEWSESLVDRWKGRAFQQRDGNAADIGGFEDENHWTTSSVTLGERAGPVRVLRETWGADSGTHVTRLDVFYPDFFHQVYRMRVHPVPPDGVYAFWDHRAGMVDTYYTPLRAEGVAIDGRNDELYGLNSEWQEDALGATYFAIDAPDPTLSGVLANEMWDQVSGPHGSLVSYLHAPDTRGGALMPYYRDDAAFDDGTGHDAGSWGAHGIHFFVTGDMDNLFLPAPVSELAADVRTLVLSGRAPNVGEAFATLERVPLVVTTT